MVGRPITTEVAARLRVRMHSLRSTMPPVVQSSICLLYPSDAADEEERVELGCRRCQKHKTNK